MNTKSNLLLCAVLSTCLLTGCKDCDNGDKVIFWADCPLAPDTIPNPSKPSPVTQFIKGRTFTGDSIWKNGPAAVDYCLEGLIMVKKTLTVEPGTVICAKPGATLFFDGPQAALIARGTPDQPITFRSETNSKGGWHGMTFDDSNNPLNELRYVIIKDGGSGSDRANISFDRRNQIRLSYCTISNSLAYGLVEDAYSELTLNAFEHNAFNDNASYPLFLLNWQVRNIGNTSTFSGNTQNFIALKKEGALTGTHAWKKQSVPYYWTSPGSLAIGGHSTTGSLTLEAGVTLEMGPGSSIVVDYNSSSLTLAGTADEKVRIVGNIRQAGAWQGILIDTPSMNNTFTHAVISHGGATGLARNANIVMGSYSDSESRLVLNNVELSNSAGCGISRGDNKTHVLISEGVTYTGNAGGDVCPR